MEENKPRMVKPPEHHSPAEEDYEAASKATVDYEKYMPKLKAEHKLIRRIVTYFILLLVIAGLGVLAYVEGPKIGSKYLGGTGNPKTTTVTSKSTNKPSTTKLYTSTNQGLTFNYPAGWTVSESADEILATSPVEKLTSFEGQKVNGKVMLSVRDQNVALTEFSTGTATAAINSRSLTYKAPAAGQRSTTNISFISYAKTGGQGIDGVYITGSNNYQAGQDAPKTDFNGIDPLIAFTFVQCSNAKCSGTTPLTISTDSWNNSSFSSPLQNILASFVINS